MKKGLCIAFTMIIILCSSGFALDEERGEITFLGIPWLASEEETIKTLNDKGFLRTLTAITDTNEEVLYIQVNSNENYDIVEERHNEYCHMISLKGSIKGKIGGYPIDNLTLTYIYDGEDKLVLAEVDLLGAQSQDVKEKLKKVYGTYKEMETVDGKSFVWEGANHSCVILSELYGGQAFELIYGRNDAGEILSKCYEIDPNDVSGL